MKIVIVVVVLALVTVAAVPAFAQDLYDNGPTNGTVDAWAINFGFSVSNSFTVNSAATIYDMTFAAWLLPGDVLQSAEISITSSEFGGTTYFDQTVNFMENGCVSNQYGYNVCDEYAFFSGVSLNAGTYWLNLQNASVNTGDPVYWDENSGPSSGSQNEVGTIPSESFTLQSGCAAGAGCLPPPSMPEPGSLLLFGSGVVAVVGALRRTMNG
jgi:hypothetical protein